MESFKQIMCDGFIANRLVNDETESGIIFTDSTFDSLMWGTFVDKDAIMDGMIKRTAYTIIFSEGENYYSMETNYKINIKECKIEHMNNNIIFSDGDKLLSIQLSDSNDVNYLVQMFEEIKRQG